MIRKILIKNSELIRYTFWGIITVIVNYISYLLFKQIAPYQIANIFSIVFTKIFAYCTNKKFVFRAKTRGLEQIKEIVKYVMSRSFTGIVDFFGLILLTELCRIDDKIGKIIMMVVTTVLNYILGKLFVFRKKQTNQI